MNELSNLNRISILHFVVLATLVSLVFGCAGAQQKQTDGSQVDGVEIAVWPKFDADNAQQFLDSCQTQYNLANAKYQALELTSKVTDRVLLKALNDIDVIIDGVASNAVLMSHVHPDANVRAAAEVCEQKIVSLYSNISLSRPIFNKIVAVNKDSQPPINQRFVEKMLQGYELAGVNQNETVRQRIRVLNDEITKVGQEFSKNIRSDVRFVMMRPEALKGLPSDYISAHPVDANGMIKITTEYPDYYPFMQYAESDSARKELYIVFRQRGYPANKAVLQQLLTLRFELAQLLGFDHYADYITSDKMVSSAVEVAEFIDQINSIALGRSGQDYDALLARLQKIDPTAREVGDWQKTYLENLIKNEVYQVDSQVIRQYFSYEKVRGGIFGLVEHMFNVQIKPWQTPTWHESVESYGLWDGDLLIGQFHLDMHPREGKYKHAAAFSIREGVANIQTPIKALVCNFPGGNGAEGLMEHDQVETFLHEFGHLLHGLFSGHQPWLALSGISTERDFVEAPSQMLEEWVWNRETLVTFATNNNGDVLPDDIIKKMNAGHSFGRGIWTRHQLFYAALSLNYYNRNPENIDLDATAIKLQQKYSPFPYVDNTYLYTSFGHLDGYSAMYYTYMWSLVIASDMFSEFQKLGLRNPEVTERYRKAVLSAGSTKPAAELVKDFLGRDFNFDAFKAVLEENPPQ